MQIIKDLILRFLSRKFLATVAFGGVIPIVFHQLGISDNVVMASMALAGIYAGTNILEKKGP